MEAVDGSTVAPVGRRLSVDPADSLDSVVPVTDVTQWLGVQDLSDDTVQTLSAETARLVRQQRHQYPLQPHRTFVMRPH